ncbi:general transcription factor II-I repeat domain-containing protein 2-like [Rhynchocyon petersi]
MAQVVMSAPPMGGQESSESRVVVTFLMSALESMCKELAKSKAEVACIAMYEADVFVVGTEKGCAFVNARTDFQEDFAKYCVGEGLPEMKPSGPKEGTQADSGEAGILRKAVEDHFCLCYGKALGTTAMVPVPYEKILRDQAAVIAQGLPEGVTLKHPENYDLTTLKRILENKAGISFTVNRWCLEPADPPGSTHPPGTTNSTACVEDLNIIQVPVPDSEKEKLSSAEKIKELREQVNELFSRKFGEAIGVDFPVKVPYRKITFNPGCVVVDGMPPGVTFKAPGYLEISSMRRILDAADFIKFTVIRGQTQDRPRGPRVSRKVGASLLLCGSAECPHVSHL